MLGEIINYVSLLILTMPLFGLIIEWIRRKDRNLLYLFFSLVILEIMTLFEFVIARRIHPTNLPLLSLLTSLISGYILFVMVGYFSALEINYSKTVKTTYNRLMIFVLLTGISIFLSGTFFLYQLEEWFGELRFVWTLLIIIVLGVFLIKNIDINLGIQLAILCCWFFSTIKFPFTSIFTLVYFGMLTYLVSEDCYWSLLGLNQQVQNLKREREVAFNLLSNISTSVRDITSTNETLKLIIKSAMTTTHAGASAIYLLKKEEGTPHQILSAEIVEGFFWPLHPTAELTLSKEKYIHNAVLSHHFKVGEGIVGSVAQTSTAILIKNGQKDERLKKLGPIVLNIRTLLAVPLKIKNDLLGVLIVMNKMDESGFDENDQSILQALADQAALSINNARLYVELTEQERMKRELEIATQIQSSLLPKEIPHINGITISGNMIPAKEIGGDYYDYIKMDDDHMGIIIGDVAGKGVPAGMIMLIVRTIIHVIAKEVTSTKLAMEVISQKIYHQMDSKKFMTLLYLFWDNRDRTLKYTSAGHEHILLYRKAENRIERIKSGGLAIGMHEQIGQFLSEKQLKMNAGDTVLLYTDGVTEARNENSEMYGLDRLQKTLEKYSSESAEMLRCRAEDEVKSFMSSADQYDDITLVAFKIK